MKRCVEESNVFGFWQLFQTGFDYGEGWSIMSDFVSSP
jgi:hypothetical protein